MSAKELFLKIKKQNKNVVYCENLKEVVKQLNQNTPIAFVGAGDINLIAEQIVGLDKTKKVKLSTN